MSDIDDTDLKLITLLQDDASLTNLTAAEALNTSEATIRRRRLRLEQEGYIKMMCAANPLKMGFTSVAIIGLQVIGARVPEVELKLQAIEQVHFAGVTSGNYDIFIEAWFRSSDDLYRFKTKTLGSIDGIIRADVFHFLHLSKFYGWTGGRQLAN